MPRTVVVVGGGVSGLAVAYELGERAQRLGDAVGVLCLEATARAGGNIRTERADGFVCEAGPTGFLDNAPATLMLVRRLQLSGQVVRAQPRAANRFIFRKGRLRKVPLGPAALLTSGILSPWGKLRLLAEPLAPRSRREDESVYEFASRRIGREAAGLLVDAMVSGIYAGDVRRLSLGATFPKMRRMEQEHGSLFRAMLARRRRSSTGSGERAGGPAGPGGVLTSFRGGLEELTGALARALGSRLRTGSRVSRIADMGRRGFRILPDEGPPIEADAVVLACPAWNAAPIVGDMDADLARAMEGIESAPLVVVHMGFRTLALGDQPEGFGFLVPRGQGPRSLGTLWISQIFENRAPDGASLYTTMLGGAHDPRAIELDDDRIVEIVRGDLQQTMSITARPYFVRLVRWPRGIPQYTLGHLRRLDEIGRRLGTHPGLFVAGNSYRGISVNACVEEAPQIAEAALEYVARRIDPAAG